MLFFQGNSVTSFFKLQTTRNKHPILLKNLFDTVITTANHPYWGTVLYIFNNLLCNLQGIKCLKVFTKINFRAGGSKTDRSRRF